MTPTAELRTRLRKLLNEQIPAGGSDADTRFLDADLDTLLTEAVNIYGAAAAGWTMKAGMLQAQVESYSVGQEDYDLTSLKDQVDHALRMAEQYAKMASVGFGSAILKLTPPEVL
jgi:hypothetical protein